RKRGCASSVSYSGKRSGKDLVLCQHDFGTSITVMPAQAGIQKPRPFALDSRCRGNDTATVSPSTLHRLSISKLPIRGEYDLTSYGNCDRQPWPALLPDLPRQRAPVRFGCALA